MNKLNPALKTNERSAVERELPAKSAKKNSINEKKIRPDRVSLSDSYKENTTIKGKNIVSDVRYDLVKKYREVLADGSYQVKSDELADKIVQKVKENKNAILL